MVWWPAHWYTAKIEPLAGYAGQSTCSPFAKPGTTAFANLLLRTYPRSRSLGIVRACSVGGKSEHKEGRAFDWGVSAHDARDRASVKALVKWLMQPDRFGNRHAMARRLGIQYMIWNRRIWGSYSASSGWRRYTGANPHTDHVHFSLSWAGARKKSSFWRPRNFSVSKPPPTSTPPSVPEQDPWQDPHQDPIPAPQTRALPEPYGPDTLESGAALLDEHLVLPADRQEGVLTQGALQRGHRYLIEASGKYKYDDGARAVADAECSNGRQSSWRRDRSIRRDQGYSDHFDLYIDGQDMLADADSGQDCDTDAHVYRWIYEPARDGRAPLQIWDPTNYADNAGQLKIRITDIAERDRMTWAVPATARAGATSPGSLRGGVDYQVTVSGTWQDGTGVTADAECSRTDSDATWRRDRSVDPYDPGGDQFDVLVSHFHSYNLSPDREDVRGDPATDTGDRCDTTSHTYSFVWRSDESVPLNLRVDDPGSHRNNSGRLQVEVKPYGETTNPGPITSETVQVDSRASTAVQTSQSYPQGTRLLLSVKGGYLMRDAANWIGADAECTITSDDRTWRSTRLTGQFNGSQQPLGDVAVNGRIGTWYPKDHDGSCDEVDHEYTLELTTDRDGPLALVIADDYYADNRGSVSVTVTVR